MEPRWDPDADVTEIRRRAAAAPPPLPGLLGGLLRRIEQGVVDHNHRAGFDDVREAHNAVFAFVPAEGIRLTQLAARAGMSKQAMAELVDDLVAKGYFAKQPDPDDGRAKRIVWAERGWRALPHARAYFATVERRLAALTGDEDLARLRHALMTMLADDDW